MHNHNSFLEEIKKEEKNVSSLDYYRGASGVFYGGESGNKFLHHKFAQHMMNKYHVKKMEHRLYIYQNGIYVNDEMLIKEKMIREIINISQKDRNETLDYIRLASSNARVEEPNIIAVKNGLLNAATGEITEFSPDKFLTSKINAAYDPTAYVDDVEEILAQIANGDYEVFTLFKEMIAYVIYRKNFLDKSFLFYGEPGTGKSKLISMFREFVGKENTSTVSLQGLDERWGPARLNHKLLNAGDDIPGTSMKDSANFKKLSTGEPMDVEFKGQDAFTMEPFAKLLFSSNHIPKMNDKSEAITDRFFIIPFLVRFRGTDKVDPHILEKLTSETARSHLLNIAIEYLPILLERKSMTVPEVVRGMTEQFIKENNPLTEFLEDTEVHNLPTKEAHKVYMDWAYESGYKHPLTRNRFTTAIKEMGYETRPAEHFIDGRKTSAISTFFKIN